MIDEYDPVQALAIPLIEELSDKEYQESVWLQGESPHLFCYIDMLGELSEAHGIFTSVEERDKMTNAERAAFCELYEMVEEFDDKYLRDTKDLSPLLEMPEWQVIRKKAQEILELFLSK